MKKLLAKTLILSSLFFALVGCGGSSDESESTTSGNTPTTSSVTPEDEPELPEGSPIVVYLKLSAIGLYEGKAGKDIPEYFIENAVALETKVGDPLPGADKVTSTTKKKFLGWVKYDGSGAPTKYEKAPNKNHQILQANFEG